MDTFFNPVKVQIGNGCISELGDMLARIHIESNNILVLVWNNFIKENTEIKCIAEKNQEYNWKFLCFKKSNPDTADLFNLYNDTKDWNVGLIIAIGGGSVLDVGKSLCCLYGNNILNERELIEGIKAKKYNRPVCKWIGVPTTAGTGSEVTCWATIWNTSEGGKLSLESKDNYAYGAFVDPEFAKSMPMGLTISSALDAAAHATEAFWAKGTNIVSKSLALRAIKIIMEHIEDIFDKEKEEEAHNYLAQGSLLAGMAFSNTKTTACHSLSYPLTLRYNIPHGAAVSMLLASVMEINIGCIKEADELYDAYGVTNVCEVRNKINRIMERASIPYTLREWNVKEEDIPSIAIHGGTKGRIDNNPVELDTIAIEKILKSIY